MRKRVGYTVQCAQVLSFAIMLLTLKDIGRCQLEYEKMNSLDKNSFIESATMSMISGDSSS
jgi:hypothetical protein